MCVCAYVCVCVWGIIENKNKGSVEYLSILPHAGVSVDPSSHLCKEQEAVLYTHTHGLSLSRVRVCELP